MAHSQQPKRWVCPRSLGDDETDEMAETDETAETEEIDAPKDPGEDGEDVFGEERETGAVQLDDSFELPPISLGPCVPDRTSLSTSRDDTMEIIQQKLPIDPEVGHRRPARNRRMPNYLDDYVL